MYGSSYKNEYPNGDDCAYCGDNASTIDHIPSLQIVHLLVCSGEGDKYKRVIVPCCSDCNTRLGSVFAFTIRRRKNILLTRLRKKYKNILRKVQWDDEDKEELGCNLRQYIETSHAKREIVLSRLRNLEK